MLQENFQLAKIKRLERKIDKAIADYNNSVVMSMVNQHGGKTVLLESEKGFGT